MLRGSLGVPSLKTRLLPGDHREAKAVLNKANESSQSSYLAFE